MPLCLWGLQGDLFYEVDGDYEEGTLLRFMVLMRTTFMRFMGCIGDCLHQVYEVYVDTAFLMRVLL